MKIKYEKRKIIVETCSTCKERLMFQYTGSRWKCACGYWISDWSNPTEYEIVKEVEKP